MAVRLPKTAHLYGPTYQSLAARVGANVRRMREAAGLTQEQLAEKCHDLDPAVLRVIESGRANVTLVTLARLSDGLDVGAAEFLAPCEIPPRRPRGRPAKEPGDK